jgi:hypothetical protein
MNTNNTTGTDLGRERKLFEAFLQTPAPDNYDASNADAWHIWQAARRAPQPSADRAPYGVPLPNGWCAECVGQGISTSPVPDGGDDTCSQCHGTGRADRAPADGAGERFYMDHGVWHDRVTGQHMWTQDQYDEQWRDMYKAGQEHAAIGYNMLGGGAIDAPTAAPADGARDYCDSNHAEKGFPCACVTDRAPAAGDSPSPQPGVDEAGERSSFDQWAQIKYRNADRYSNSAYDYGMEAWLARAAITRRAPAAAVGRAALDEFIEKVCGGKSELIACAESAFYWFNKVAQQGAAHAQDGEENARDAARYRWIEEHATTNHGGNGFLIKCFVPVDSEDMGCGIDEAMAAPAQRNGSDQ